MNIQVQPNSTLTNKTGAWRTFKPKFLPDKCTACGICPRLCPEGVIYQTDRTNILGKLPYACDFNYCKGCGLCVIACPFKAVVMELDQK